MNRRDLILAGATLAACAPAASVQTPAPFPMRRGVNLGNALEAPNEGEWGYRIELEHLDTIAAAGFDGVRLPVRWDIHADSAPPYAIEPDFLRRIDEIIEHALELGLVIQLDLHHYERLISEPERHRERFRGLWAQIARRYRRAPAGLVFEPFNEPNGDHWTGVRLRMLQADVLAVIRRHSPERLVVLGGPNWSSIDGLNHWTAPADPHTALSVHYYEPYELTHHRAEWLEEPPEFARAWGSEADRQALAARAEHAAQWARAHGLSLQLGEFGINRSVSLSQRAAWTRAVREAFEAKGAGWCVWDFAGAFPIWDRESGAFIPEMVDALLN